jgi:hypothetical protein
MSGSFLLDTVVAADYNLTWRTSVVEDIDAFKYAKPVAYLKKSWCERRPRHKDIVVTVDVMRRGDDHKEPVSANLSVRCRDLRFFF